MEGSFIQVKLRTSPGVQSPPRKKAFWRNIVFNTPLYFVETKNMHTSNMTVIFLQGFNRDVGFLGGSDGKEYACNGGDCVLSLGGEDPLKKRMATHSPVFLPGEFHEQRKLAGYTPWGCKEQDTTEQLTLSLHYS